MTKKSLARILACGMVLLMALAGCSLLKKEAKPFAPDSYWEQREISLKAEQLLRTGDYAEIEKRMAAYRRKTNDYPDGTNNLVHFSYGLMGVWNLEENTWFDMQQQLLVWRKAQPASKTMQIALAGNYLMGELALYNESKTPELSEQDGKKREQRTAEASRLLAATRSVRMQYPEWYFAQMENLSWEKKDEDAFFRTLEEGSKKFPELQFLHFSAANLQIWRKTPSQPWYEYVEKVANGMQKGEGDRFCARVMVRLLKYLNAPPEVRERIKQLDWPRTKRGFESLLADPAIDPEEFSGPYAVTAWIMRDRDTLQTIFNGLDKNKYDARVWKDAQEFEKARQWALE